MTNYVFIESRDPFVSRDTRFVEETAISLRKRGHEVTVFLVQNAVLAARQGARNSCIACMVEAGVKLLADDFSLCERGIQPTEVCTGVRPSEIDVLVDAITQENTRAIWH